MSVTYGFYNSLNGDRKYTASQLSNLFDGLIQDGIFASVGSKLMVSESSGMVVSVGTGRAWFNHAWTYNDAILLLTLSDADMLLNRIDAVILEVNSLDATRANTIKIITGTPASSPVNPTMISEQSIHQYPLAYIYVAQGATSISQANITNAVGTSACPFVIGVVEGTHVDDLVAQWLSEWTAWVNTKTDEFDDWFANIQGQLSGDIATNLQNQITLLQNAKKTNGYDLSSCASYQDIMNMALANPYKVGYGAVGNLNDACNFKTLIGNPPWMSNYTSVKATLINPYCVFLIAVYGATAVDMAYGFVTYNEGSVYVWSGWTRAKNFIISDTDLTPGTSPLKTGDVHFYYV